MEKFKYKVSVIVPVYNVELFLRNCLESLVTQTIDKRDMEVLLINDGSTDGSLDICKEYAKCYSFIKLIDKENEGVSATRNLGLKIAEGKYIFFLDSDDWYSENVLEKVSDFFDKHYDEVDVVSYYDQYYLNGKPEKPHMRYKYLKDTGIYDLNEVPYALQLRLSMCTKNLREQNILFDEKMGYQEDQKYCAYLLEKRLKLGFVKEAVYHYNKNDLGVVSNSTNPIVMFEKTMAYFENLFSEKEEVPLYYQALFFHDIQWKFATSCLYPYHYDEKELSIAKNRVYSLLNKVDVSIIMAHSNLDNYQKLYWIRMKQDHKLTPILMENKMDFFYENKKIYGRKDIEIILKRIYIGKNYVKFTAYFKSPFFSLIDDNHFYVIENGVKKELNVTIASNSYYKAKERTDCFWGFSYKCYVEETTELKFLVCMDGIEYETVYWIPSNIPFSKTAGYSEMCSDNVKVELKNNIFYLTKINTAEFRAIVTDNTKNIKNNKIRLFRDYFIENYHRKIWLYIDNYSTPYDNGWLQFVNDFSKDDGIERYYIVTNKHWRSNVEVKEEYENNIVDFGSDYHKILYICAEKLLTAFIEKEVCCPLNDSEAALVSDILNIEIIYLQHGVLHAHLPWYYSPTCISVDKEVVSTNFEIDNLSTNYGFNKEDLIPSGMPRYDYIDKNKKAKNWILFAPSWRSYLVGDIVSGNETRSGNSKNLLKSNYYKNIEKFINDEKLNQKLKEKGIVLYLKLHPEFFSTYSELPWINSDVVKLAPEKVELTDYKAFMTDFSSFVFDYAYLNRPILYFVPDYIEFKAGLNRYRELDLPFEEAFGPLASTSEMAAKELIKIIDRDFEVSDVYAKRMENFYLKNDTCCEKLYEFLINEE